jgi:hypothetical protein
VTSPGFDVLAAAEQSLGKWQPRLRLADWDIWVEIGTVDDDNWAAQTDKEWRARRAHITFPENYIERVRERAEVLPGETDEQLVEHDVLHELVHILEEPEASHVDNDVVWFFGDSEHGGVFSADFRNAWRDYREWLINQVVRVLLDAERTRGWT